jgi:uncharacterized Zn finger protein (UPF0148 family)
METQNKTTFTCPTCGNQLEQDGRTFCCPEHGKWQLYGARLLVQVPTDDHKVRDRFTMPWEIVPQVA